MTTNVIVVYCDGGAAPNPGHGASGFVVFDRGERVHGRGDYLGDSTTNNVAEYTAVIRALEYVVACTQHHKYDVIVHSDSMLVVEQVARRWKTSKPELEPLRDRVQALLSSIRRASLVHVLRGSNTLADSLVRRARDERGTVIMSTTTYVYEPTKKRCAINAPT